MQLVWLGSVALFSLALGCGGVTSRSFPEPSTTSGGAGPANVLSSAGSGTGGEGGFAIGGFGVGGAGAPGGGGAAAAAAGDVLRSSGCGRALPPKQVVTVPGSRTGY